ncbi:helix-turn-helix domain-containing protein [Spiroplasma endosymbiont of Andrena trimmerana]|uniref:helix-turn-helix domain-containing protein n=1 Tax=Spiroplasma endosymbiont of Andrena trimmerana TaxID=3066316 RepID=UPI0030D0C0D0
MSYKHLGIDERIYIENQLKFKFKISEIAKNLNRSISTINYVLLTNQLGEKVIWVTKIMILKMK